MNDKRIKQFYRFLKENNIYKAYKINFDKEFSNNKNLKSFLINASWNDIIFDAFMWSGTVEGNQFWGEISDKWENYIIEKMKNEQ